MKKILWLIVLLGAFACSYETELKRSIFISDPDAPELPKYSEWGYNTFGAFYDRQVFISNDEEVPMKVIQEDSKTSFVLTGQKGQGYYGRSNSFSLTIVIDDYTPDSYDALMVLHDTTLDLTSQNYEVVINDGFAADTVSILSGSFEFVRAQHLLVNELPQQVILSGVFAFQGLVNGVPITVSNGRFDVGVDEFNFFKYQ